MAKPPSDKLHRLIQSLSAAEKRYLRIYIRGKTNRDSKYLQLFEQLAQAETYQSEQIKAAIYGPDNNEGKKYPEMKAYLYDLLLECLHSYDEAQSVENRVTRLLQGVTSMFKRGHYRECDELLEKAFKIASRYELFAYQLDIYRWKRHLAYTRMDIKFLHSELELLDYQEAQALQQLNNLTAYRSAFFQMYALIKKDAYQRDPNRQQLLRNIIPDTLFSGPEKAVSVRSLIMYYRTINLYHYASQEINSFYETGKKLIEVIENQKEFQEENQSEYIAALFNFIIACGIRQEYAEVRRTLVKLRNIRPRTEDDRRKIHRQYYSSMFALCQFTGTFEEGRAEMIRCREEAEQLHSKDYETTSFYFQYFYIAFGCDDYEEALDYLNLWLAQPRSVEREDLQSLARILALIVHYELNNTLLLDSLIRSTKRFLRQKNRLYALEKRFIELMQHLIRTSDAKEQTAFIKSFESDWNTIPGVNALNQIFDLKSWIDAKISGTTFSETVREKYEKLP
jgi:hypothetical protein